MNEKETLLEKVEKVKNDRKKLIELKNTLTSLELFEIAAKAREYEKELYPLSEEDVQFKRDVELIQGCLRMTDLSCDLPALSIIVQVINLYNKIGADFSIKDAVEIQAKTDKLY